MVANFVVLEGSRLWVEWMDFERYGFMNLVTVSIAAALFSFLPIVVRWVSRNPDELTRDEFQRVTSAVRAIT